MLQKKSAKSSNANRKVVSGTTIIINPELAKHLGKSPAIILQQLHYWLSLKNPKYGIIENGIQWIRNSYKEWQTQLPHFSTKTIQRAFLFLEKKNIVLSKRTQEKVNHAGGNQVKYFTINYDALEEFLKGVSDLVIYRTGMFEPSNLKALENKGKKTLNPGQNDHPFTKTTSNLKKIHKKKSQASTSKTYQSKISQQEGNLKNIFEKDHIQNIVSMKQIWNSVVEGIDDEICFEEISRSEKAYLIQALDQYFKGDVNLWKQFCEKITTSSFLMGEKSSFRVCLSWVLRFSNLQKIMSGTMYGLGDRSPKPFKNSNTNQEINHSVDLQGDVDADGFVDEKYQEKAKAIRQSILDRVGEGAYISWFSNARLMVNQNQNSLILCVDSKFKKNTIINRYDRELKGLVDDVCFGEEIPYVLSKGLPNTKANTEECGVLENTPKEEKFLLEHEEVLEKDISLSNQSISKKIESNETVWNEEEIKPLVNIQEDVEADGFIDKNLQEKGGMVRQYILDRLGEGAYISWFSNARLMVNQNQKLVLWVDSKFKKNTIINRYEKELKVLVDDVCVEEKMISVFSKDLANTEECDVSGKTLQELVLEKEEVSEKDVSLFNHEDNKDIVCNKKQSPPIIPVFEKKIYLTENFNIINYSINKFHLNNDSMVLLE